jgi:hypothetical protein
MSQMELFVEEKKMVHRSRGRIHYRKFSIHEKINWKSWWVSVELNHSKKEKMRMYWAYNTQMLQDFPLESINESQQNLC